MTYTNPIIPGFHPDPSCCRVGDDYYLVTSSFEYFPGVPLFHSRDLVNWTQIGHVLTRRSQLELERCGPSGGIYAPTIRHHNGRTYMITTNVSHKGNFLVWTDDIRGPWSDPVWIEAPGIDPSLFFDLDGTVYYTGNGADHEAPGIYGFAIDVTTGKAIGPRSCLWNGTGGAYPEGPHLYRVGDWYYLLLSEGGTEHGHMLTIARSRQPLGPFEGCPRNPILTNRSLRTRVKAVGHGDLVEGADGRWWMVCLAIRPIGYPECHHLGRETFLAPVVWDSEGWPVVGNHGVLDLEMTVEGSGPVQQGPRDSRETFSLPALGPDWCFLRNPSPGVSWGTSAGLVLRGTSVSLDDVDSPAFLGRRLEHFDLHVATALTFDPVQDGDEAGLTVLLNHRHHYEIGVALVDGVKSLLFRRRIGSLWKVEASVACPSGPLILGLNATAETLSFTYRVGSDPEVVLGEGETRFLSTEVGGAFTGSFVGVYATGRGRDARTEARFAWVDYSPRATGAK